MAEYIPGLITPPREKEELSPYRSSWRSIWLENASLVLVCGILFVMGGFITPFLPVPLLLAITVIVSAMPVLSWVIFSWFPEQRATRPRPRLFVTLLLSGLIANAVAVPLVTDVVRPDEWLSTTTAQNRILGYALTVGVIYELLKYLVIRYLVWESGYKTLDDPPAYAAASAAGFSLVVTLHLLLQANPPPLEVSAQRVIAVYSAHLSASLCVAYGLSGMRFGRSSSVVLSLFFLLGCAIHGIAIPVRAGLVNAAFSLSGAFPREVFGLVFSILLLFGPAIGFYLLTRTAERVRHQVAPTSELEAN